MSKQTFSRFLSLLLAVLMLQISFTPVFAADPADNDQKISGKVMDPDKKKPIAHVTVRIVQAESGQSQETETNVNGCYNFDKVTPGVYALSVVQKNNEFVLADKIRVEPKVKLMACVALAPNNNLEIVTKGCKCREFPWLVLILGTGAASGALIAGQNDQEEASPSQP